MPFVSVLVNCLRNSNANKELELKTLPCNSPGLVLHAAFGYEECCTPLRSCCESIKRSVGQSKAGPF